MKAFCDYLLARLGENSTWRGIILLLTSAGVCLDEQRAGAIIAAGLAVVGVINVFRKGKAEIGQAESRNGAEGEKRQGTAAVQNLAAVLLCLGMTGCTSLTYESPTGERVTRIACGLKVSMAELDLVSDTNGVRHVRMKGYLSDGTATAAAVTDAAVNAAVKAAIGK